MPNGLTPEERREIRAQLEQAFEKSVADALMDVFERMVQRHAEIALREDLRALYDIVREMAIALRDLQRTVAQLAEAQARTEARIERLEEAVAQLAEAQARTEDRVGRLEAAVPHLLDAHARMEERVGRLEERTARLEEIVAQLIEAQARTQEELRALAASHAEAIKRLERLEQIVAQVVETQRHMLEEQVHMQRVMRQLAQQLGADLEDMAYIVLRDVLKRELGWDVEPLERTWKKWNDEVEEVNIFGRARDPRRPEEVIWIVGEAKYNLTVREVERFAQLVERARNHLKGEIFPVCFCRRARPEVEERVRELGFHLVYSYGRLL